MCEYEKRVAAYRLAMSMAESMRKREIISDDDLEKISKVMAKKYGISLSSIFAYKACYFRRLE